MNNARNLGLAIATGKEISLLIRRLCSAEDFFEIILEILFVNKVDLVRCGFYELNDSNVVINTCQFENERISHSFREALYVVTGFVF